MFQLDGSGNTTLTEKVQTIKDLPGNIWFPEKSRLHVQVEVIERATGSKESAVDNSCLFTSSPYIVEFKNTPNYFKPGFPFRAKVWFGKIAIGRLDFNYKPLKYF